MNYIRQQEKRSQNFVLFVAALILLSLASATPARAQQCTDIWTGADGNDEWSDPANWSTGKVPGPSDTACVQIGNAAVNQNNSQDSVANLALGSTDSLTLSNVPNANNGFFVDGASIVNNGEIVIPYTTSNQTGTTLNITSGGNTTLSGSGLIVISNGSGISGYSGSTLVNQSTITGAGAIENGVALNNTSSGVINANQSGLQLVVGRMPASTNTGLLEATGGGQMVIGSIGLNNVGGTIKATGTGSSVTFVEEGEGGQTITGGTFTTSSGGSIYSDNSTLLDGTNGNTIANQGLLVLPDAGNNPGSSFQGTFNNSGTIQILSHGDNVGLGIPSGQTFTLQGTGNLTMGDGTSNAYNNLNNISGNIFVNHQLIQGTGQIENLSSFTNAGTINANIPQGTNNLQLVIYRDGADTNTGTLEATKGGALVLQSLTLNNHGGTVKAIGKPSYVYLNGMTLSGGKISSSGGAVIYNTGGALIDGATEGTVSSTATILVPAVGNNANGRFQGAVTNNGIIQILANANGGVSLGIPSSQTFTLSGSGSLIMGDGTSNSYNSQNYINGNIFVNQQLVEGTGAIQDLNGFTNSGTLNANIPTGPNGLQLLVYRTGTTSNTGTMEASNGGSLYLSNSLSNAGGSIEAVGANSVVTTNGMTISGGTLSASGGGVFNDTQGTLLDGTTNPVVIDGTLSIPPVGNNPGVAMQGTIKNTGTIALFSNSSSPNNGVGVPGGETLTLTGSGDFVMGDGTNNSYNNGLILNGNGILDNQSTITGTGQIGYVETITNQGTISANVPVGSADLVLEIWREGTGGISNSGTMEAANGGELQIFPSNSFTNSGTLTAQVGSTIYINNRFTNLSNNTLTGGTYIVAGTLMIPGDIDTNAAKITLNGAASQILNPNSNALANFATNAPKASFTLSAKQNFESASTFTNQGSIIINKGSTFTVGSGGSYLQTEGKTTVNGKLALSTTEEKTDEADSDSNPAAANIRIAKGSLLGNGGTIAAHVSSSGTVIPAASLTTTGKLGITGTYTQTAAGALDANIAGAASGQFNVLNVTGAATLGGTLNIGLLDKFVPAVGDTFEILTAKKVTGTFATVNGTKINDSEHFTVTYNAGNVTLTVVSGD
jgi:hypothetical protein